MVGVGVDGLLVELFLRAFGELVMLIVIGK